MPQGKRPDKPENAPAIGFSDSLWAFTQRCWSGGVGSRPGAGEVVTCLGEAVASWDGLMPPCAPVEKVTSDSKGVSDSKKYSELRLPPLLDTANQPTVQMDSFRHLRTFLQGLSRGPLPNRESPPGDSTPRARNRCGRDSRRPLPNPVRGSNLSPGFPRDRNRRNQTVIFISRPSLPSLPSRNRKASNTLDQQSSGSLVWGGDLSSLVPSNLLRFLWYVCSAGVFAPITDFIPWQGRGQFRKARRLEDCNTSV